MQKLLYRLYYGDREGRSWFCNELTANLYILVPQTPFL